MHILFPESMKCRILFSVINKKNIINLSSDEFTHRVVKVKPTHMKTFLASYENNLKSACAFTQSVQELDPEMFHLHIAQ